MAEPYATALAERRSDLRCRTVMQRSGPIVGHILVVSWRSLFLDKGVFSIKGFQMARMKRFNFSEFGRRKQALPRGFEFLDGFRFHSIVEHTEDGRIQRRIEVLPTTLRRTIEQASMGRGLKAKCEELARQLKTTGRTHAKELRDLKKELIADKENAVNQVLDERKGIEKELATLKSQCAEWEKKYRQLERNNEILMSRSDESDKTHSGQKSPKSFFDKAEATKFHGLPYPGGLPGLGKRSR
jgi:hypothetical protein